MSTERDITAKRTQLVWTCNVDRLEKTIAYEEKGSEVPALQYSKRQQRRH